MRVNVRRVDGVSVVDLEGMLDAYHVLDVRGALDGLMEQDQCRVVMCFENVVGINYAGLGGLVERLKKIREHDGDIKLVGLNHDVRRVFHRLRANRVFDSYATEDEAVRSFQATAVV